MNIFLSLFLILYLGSNAHKKQKMFGLQNDKLLVLTNNEIDNTRNF